MTNEQEYLGGAPLPDQPTGQEYIGKKQGEAPPAPAAPEPGPAAGATEDERLAAATLAGPLRKAPFDYDQGTDWQTIRGGDPFRILYLDYRQYARISDEQVRENARVLAEFWESKRTLAIGAGRDRMVKRYGEGTIEKAPKLLEKAVDALGTADGRKKHFTVLETRRLQHAREATLAYLLGVFELTNKVMIPKANEAAQREGVRNGFTPTEAETFLLDELAKAGLAPPASRLKTGSNLLLETWTPGGQPLTGQPHTNVLGQEVYSLAEAAQVLYEALADPARRDKAQRNLDSSEYLTGVAADLKQRDAQQDVNDLFKRVALPKEQRRLSALYLFGPGLPFDPGGKRPAFASPADLLARAASSTADFAVAEEAYAAGLLPIWLRAAGTASVKDALPATKGKSSALDLRRFLHAARPDFPLWIGDQSLTSPAALAAFIRRDERTWELVYGSLTSGYLGPWLAALGQPQVLDRQAQLAGGLLAGTEPTSEAGRRLTVQALLEALDPQAARPALQVSAPSLDLTGLSGETKAERTLTLTNTTGGPVRVRLALTPALDGVALSTQQLVFDQRAPGQQLSVTVTGDPAQMPRDGQHQAELQVVTSYQATAIPVTAEAVFPQKEFWQFVAGAGLALAAVFGGVRWLLGLALGVERYQQAVVRNSSLPLRAVFQLGGGDSLVLVGMLLLLLLLTYVFGRVLLKLAKPRPTS